MSTVLAPFGFQPRFHPSGSANPRTKGGSVQTPPTNSLYQQQPVSFDTNGLIIPAVTFGTPNTILPVKGVFWGIQYSEPSGFVKQNNQFLAGTPTFNSATSGVNQGDVYSTWVYPQIYQDNDMEFYVQANGPMLRSYIGMTFDIDVTTINNANASGISAVALANTPVSGNAGNFIVSELAVLPQTSGSNQWGDLYTIVLVKLNTNY